MNKCFWINPYQNFKQQDGWCPSIVFRDIPGHHPCNGMIWGPSLATAQTYCNIMNVENGLDDKIVEEILLSASILSKKDVLFVS